MREFWLGGSHTDCRQCDPLFNGAYVGGLRLPLEVGVNGWVTVLAGDRGDRPTVTCGEIVSVCKQVSCWRNWGKIAHGRVAGAQ